ncbi:FtsX-like permease family protein [Salipaludibacillus sp. LMS25]|jgi:putative ABC transport system permease protein|uniref:ABC transporter permease n=1 Tax=Salipaludibacillus sp. LMS25 TaxID=2924031 RepID=UPI0020D066B8|nr:FtsX-like permease family protein [Salipaludibacillus sp. LMS25]UTR16520.1 FtsX-like permease family protein [Salipaludibacillus sp. LMS25]
MNIMHKLTIRHLTQNKRRTLVTIIGTIISVAMITAVATLVISFLDLMQRQLIAEQGEWHVQYYDVNEEQAEAIKNDAATNQFILSEDRGYSYLEGSANKYKPYIFVRGYNESGFENVPMTLSEGRFPKAPDEIVLSTEILTNAKLDYEIGDKLTLEVGERVFLEEEEQEDPITQHYSLRFEDDEIKETLEHTESITYEVVGIMERPTWEPTWAPGYTAITYTDMSLITDKYPSVASVALTKVNRSLYTDAEQLASEIGLDSQNLNYNTELLRFHGITKNDNLRSTMYSLAGIIMLVIIVGSIALIYNAFAISVSERARHLGMLSSVGATKKQKRNSVFFEGTIIGLISVPLGILSGLAGIGVTFWFSNRLFQDALNTTEKLTVIVTPISVFIAISISIVTIFISTYLPARKASKISAIDAIRQTTDIKLTGKVIKTAKLVRHLFGMEAEIGLKNIKRNKRKYQITVFSLVISIILFLVVSFFTHTLERSIELSLEDINYDIQIYLSENFEMDEQSLDAISSLEDVTDYAILEETAFYTMVDETNISDLLRERVKNEPDLLEEGQYPYYVEVFSLNNESLEKYAKEIGTDAQPLFNEKSFKAIVVDQAVYQDELQGKRMEIKTINTSEGEILDLVYDDGDNEKKDFVSTITIEALTDQLPMGVTTGGGIGTIKVFVSEAVYNHLLTLESRTHSNEYIYLNSSDPIKTQEEIEGLVEGNINIYNVYKSRQQQEQFILFMSVFIYGFIALITIISIANIFNTISTSISLRKREFGMLKSVGMTPKSFNKMIRYESMFYGLKSLLYGLPISIGIMYLLHRSMMSTFDYRFELPWMSILFVIVAVFVIVGSAMLYSLSKVRKENIIETLKQENI